MTTRTRTHPPDTPRHLDAAASLARLDTRSTVKHGPTVAVVMLGVVALLAMLAAVGVLTSADSLEVAPATLNHHPDTEGVTA